MEVTINYNGQAVAVEVTLEVYEFLDRADHKTENLFHEQRRHWDGRDERLKFLGLDGILTATCCPNCVGFLKGPAFNSFTLDGGVEVFSSELFDGAEKTDCYVSPEDYKALTENPFVLGKAPVPLFYGAACQDVNTIGGFANWVQDAEYTTCPHCGKPMKYLAQIQWDTVFDCAEGTLYVEFCPDCQIVSMQHQQT